jgi:hypothetical protein
MPSGLDPGHHLVAPQSGHIPSNNSDRSPDLSRDVDEDWRRPLRRIGVTGADLGSMYVACGPYTPEAVMADDKLETNPVTSALALTREQIS